MTSVGISYLQYKEDVRKNLAQENLRDRELQETKRRNLANELETNRHNLVTESIGQRSLDETIRSNKAREIELNRSNVVREIETNRHNLATEAQSAYDTNIKYVDTLTQTRYAGEAIGMDAYGATASALVRSAGSILDHLPGIVKLFK